MAERDSAGRFTSHTSEIERIEAAQTAGLPATFAPRLKGSNPAELSDDAAALAREVGIGAQSTPQTATSGAAAMDAAIRGAAGGDRAPAPGEPARGDWLGAAMRGSAGQTQESAAAPPEPAPTTGGGFDQGATGSAPSPKRSDWIGDAMRGE